MANEEMTSKEVLDVVIELRDFIGENMVTKDDLKNFATKDDLKNFATKSDLSALQNDLTNFIDRKIFDLRGDIIAVIRKEDDKVLKLVEILKNKAVLTEKDARAVMSLEPFPKLFV